MGKQARLNRLRAADTGSQLRAADTDRERVVRQLLSAHAEGRLDLTEFDERVQQAWAARSYNQLDRLTADLPEPRTPAAPAAPAGTGARPINGFAVASLVLGSIWMLWIGSVLALIFGYIAREQIKKRGQRGAELATVGIVLGWVGVGALAILLPLVMALILLTRQLI